MVVQPPGPQLTLPDVWNEETKAGRWLYKEVLGEGGFGVVHHALDMKNQKRPVAIKILRCGKDGYRHCLLGTKEVRQARQFQEKVFSKTKHRLFLQYIEDHTGLDIYTDEELRVFEQPDFDWECDERVKALQKSTNPYLVMELIQGRCVKALTKERKMTSADIRELMHQASAALWHLYKQQKIHRDFRVHNMMWHEGRLTIIDFGLVLSAEAQHADSKNRLVRTYWKLDSYWMPPEVKKPQLKSQQSSFVPYNFAKNCPSSFDMYSFGVMALELLLDANVNAKMARNQNAIEGKGQKRLRPLDAVKFTDEAKLRAVGLSRHILNMCCARNPAHRPTPEMLLKGFQSEFPKGPVMSANKEKFFRHLHQACGQQRAENGMKMLGYLAREIVLNAANIEEYVDAMLLFTDEPNVSIYRLLCIVDCACRSGHKWATLPNTMDLVIGNFAKVVRRMMEAARKLYSADTASNRFNRHKVIEFAKKWKEMKLFHRPFGQHAKMMAESTGHITTQCPPTSNELSSDKFDRQAAYAAAKKKAAAHAAAKRAALAAAAAAEAAKAAAAAAAPPVTAETPSVVADVAIVAAADPDKVISCESIGSIGSLSSFTVSALTVKSPVVAAPDIDIVSSDSDCVVEVASHTADDVGESEDVDSTSSAPSTPKAKPLAKSWWVEDTNSRRITKLKRKPQKRNPISDKWFVENERAPVYKKVAPREVSDDDSDESSVVGVQRKPNKRHVVPSDSSSVSPPKRNARRKAAAVSEASASSSDDEEPSERPKPKKKKKKAAKRRRASTSSEDADSSDDADLSSDDSMEKDGGTSDSSSPPRRPNGAKAKRGLASSSSDSDGKEGAPSLPKRRERISSLPPTRRRAAEKNTPQTSHSRSRSRRHKPRNCLAAEESPTSDRGSEKRPGVVLTERKNVSPRRSNPNGHKGAGLFPKFPESRSGETSPRDDRGTWRLGVPWKRR